MVFKCNKRYRHRSFLDVDFYVTKINYQDDKVIQLKIDWTFQRSPDILIDRDRIQIMQKDFKNWREIA